MSKRVLLADDSATIQKLVEMALSDTDFVLKSVSDGRQAVNQLETFKPDVILADAIMPVMDGYEVCAFVKRHPRFGHVPVVLLTGRFQPFDEQRALEVKIDDRVIKPFPQDQLVALLHHLTAAAGEPDALGNESEDDGGQNFFVGPLDATEPTNTEKKQRVIEPTEGDVLFQTNPDLDFVVGENEDGEDGEDTVHMSREELMRKFGLGLDDPMAGNAMDGADHLAPDFGLPEANPSDLLDPSADTSGFPYDQNASVFEDSDVSLRSADELPGLAAFDGDDGFSDDGEMLLGKKENSKTASDLTNKTDGDEPGGDEWDAEPIEDLTAEDLLEEDVDHSHGEIHFDHGDYENIEELEFSTGDNDDTDEILEPAPGLGRSAANHSGFDWDESDDSAGQSESDDSQPERRDPPTRPVEMFAEDNDDDYSQPTISVANLEMLGLDEQESDEAFSSQTISAASAEMLGLEDLETADEEPIELEDADTQPVNSRPSTFSAAAHDDLMELEEGDLIKDFDEEDEEVETADDFRDEKPEADEGDLLSWQAEEDPPAWIAPREPEGILDMDDHEMVTEDLELKLGPDQELPESPEFLDLADDAPDPQWDVSTNRMSLGDEAPAADENPLETSIGDAVGQHGELDLAEPEPLADHVEDEGQIEMEALNEADGDEPANSVRPFASFDDDELADSEDEDQQDEELPAWVSNVRPPEGATEMDTVDWHLSEGDTEQGSESDEEAAELVQTSQAAETDSQVPAQAEEDSSIPVVDETSFFNDDDTDEIDVSLVQEAVSEEDESSPVDVTPIPVGRGAESPQLPSEPAIQTNGHLHLSEEQLDILSEKVAEKLVAKLGDGAIRQIAWDVIPELAEAIIKRRIYQLEQAVDEN